MTLKEILSQRDSKQIKIEYKIYCDITERLFKTNDLVTNITFYHGKYYEDIFYGECEYNSKTKKLIPLDGDSYSLDSQIIKYEWIAPDELTVWEDPSEQIQNFNDYKAGYDYGVKTEHEKTKKARKEARRWKNKYFKLHRITQGEL